MIKPCLTFFAAAMALAAAAEPSCIARLEFMKQVSADPVPAAELAAVVFDSDIYASTGQGFPDVRLAAAGGTEIPYLIRKETGKELADKEIPCKAKILSFRNLPDNSVEVIVERPDKKLIPRIIRVSTPNRNFEKRITVLGSDVLGNGWKTLATDAEIFNFFGVIDLENTAIRIPGPGFKYYKLLIADFRSEKASPFRRLTTSKSSGGDASVTEEKTLFTEPLKISGIELMAVEQREIREKAVAMPYPVEPASRETKDKKTVIILKSRREPLTSMSVSSNSGNYFRRADISWSDDGIKWLDIAAGCKIFSINTRKTVSESRVITFPERRALYYRITIDNGDSPPLEDIIISAAGSVYRLETLSANIKPGTRLFYGGDAKLPDYDIAQVIERLKDPTLTRLALSGQELNPDYKSRAVRLFDYKLLFYAVIGVVAIILLVIIVVSFRKIDAIAED